MARGYKSNKKKINSSLQKRKKEKREKKKKTGCLGIVAFPGWWPTAGLVQNAFRFRLERRRGERLQGTYIQDSRGRGREGFYGAEDANAVPMLCLEKEVKSSVDHRQIINTPPPFEKIQAGGGGLVSSRCPLITLEQKTRLCVVPSAHEMGREREKETKKKETHKTNRICLEI